MILIITILMIGLLLYNVRKQHCVVLVNNKNIEERRISTIG